VRGKVEVEFTDLGEQSLKNIARPLRVYRVGSAPAARQRISPAAALPLPDKPSIAVLPFQNMTGDIEQDYFVDGVVEEIITALSRIRWLFVIARNSSFTYKRRAVRYYGANSCNRKDTRDPRNLRNYVANAPNRGREPAGRLPDGIFVNCHRTPEFGDGIKAKRVHGINFHVQQSASAKHPRCQHGEERRSGDNIDCCACQAPISA
jgi:hypothetical protein